jgi:hypothetical protein
MMCIRIGRFFQELFIRWVRQFSLDYFCAQGTGVSLPDYFSLTFIAFA